MYRVIANKAQRHTLRAMRTPLQQHADVLVSLRSISALTSLKHSQMLINKFPYFYPSVHASWVGSGFVLGVLTVFQPEVHVARKRAVLTS